MEMEGLLRDFRELVVALWWSWFSLSKNYGPCFCGWYVFQGVVLRVLDDLEEVGLLFLQQ